MKDMDNKKKRENRQTTTQKWNTMKISKIEQEKKRKRKRWKKGPKCVWFWTFFHLEKPMFGARKGERGEHRKRKRNVPTFFPVFVEFRPTDEFARSSPRWTRHHCCTSRNNVWNTVLSPTLLWGCVCRSFTALKVMSRSQRNICWNPVALDVSHAVLSVEDLCRPVEHLFLSVGDWDGWEKCLATLRGCALVECHEYSWVWTHGVPRVPFLSRLVQVTALVCIWRFVTFVCCASFHPHVTHVRQTLTLTGTDSARDRLWKSPLNKKGETWRSERKKNES